jgi:hypothetical protein
MCDRLNPYAATFVIIGFDKILSFARGIRNVDIYIDSIYRQQANNYLNTGCLV